jgi:2-oxoglutarate decarboxylase
MHADVFQTMNAGYAQLMYEQWLRDPMSVDDEWRAAFSNGWKGVAPDAGADERTSGPADQRTGAPTSLWSAPARLSAVASASPSPGAIVTPIRGGALRLIQNMTDSLAVPTATSFRDIDVTVLEQRRRELNAALAPRKVSFTHLVGFALVKAAVAHPAMTHALTHVDGAPHRLDPGGVFLGLAVDVEKKDGTRTLMVPVLRHAETLDFAGFHARYEAVVEKARLNQLLPDDFRGATITLTNPGTLGTTASVPRLMAEQGTIVATGAIRDAGRRRVMTLTSTYDHRIIQGAESGVFLRAVDRLLQGADGFYEAVAASVGVPASALAPLSAPGVAPGMGAVGTWLVPGVPAPGSGSGPEMAAVAAAMSLVKAFRTHGRLAARLDPLGTPPRGDPSLEPAALGLSHEMMRAIPASFLRVATPGVTFADALPYLREVYCGTIAYETEHINDHEERVWLRRVVESGSNRLPLSAEERLAVLRRLTEVEALERFLGRAYLGQKRFSIEGVDVLVPMLDLVVELAAEAGTREVVIGMAHRGRLNVLAHVVGVPYESILAEFEGGKGVESGHAPDAGTGDVKYHLGAQGAYATRSGKPVQCTLSPNPSHLEAVDPVVEGRTRAIQTLRTGRWAHLDVSVALPVLVHGDAAFTGEGVVAETLNLARLEGYRTGGTLHIITNNQVGFTTEPKEARSTDYASDLAKGFDHPIIHVNADDPEACLAAVRLAMDYRVRFHGDVLIDLVGYRRHGHNEADEPAYTQPLMYQRIASLPTVREQWAARLVAEGLLTAEQADAQVQQCADRLAVVQGAVKSGNLRREEWADPRPQVPRAPRTDLVTAVPAETLTLLNEALLTWPEDFTVHPKLLRLLERRREALGPKAAVDWAHAEALAFATLLLEGVPIRLTGQDTERGTFSQRHLVLHDVKTGARYAPLQHLPGALAPLELHNSPLSEFAALGFEYGYSAQAPEALVIWEAQFGDFANGAQVVLDQFIASGLSKWGEDARLILLLPHGFEGQGPEHSSARIERFLQLAGENNLRVANCTTPAQYFHLLRVQARLEDVRPLVVFTPKSFLRHPLAMSGLDDLATGAFHPVVDDVDGARGREQVTRVLLCSGKVYYDLVSSEARKAAPQVAVVRVERLYPLPESELSEVLARYPNATDLVWVQEEPRNKSAWRFIATHASDVLPGIRYVGRPERASSAEGYHEAHLAEQARIVAEAFGS